MIVEKINNGFVDENGDVKPLADLTNDMEFASPFHHDTAVSTAIRGLNKVRHASRRGGRSYPEISGREISDAVQQSLSDAETSLGRELTDAEAEKIARHAELQARGIV